MNELNPNHPVTNEMREQYHKLLAYMIWTFCRRGTRGGEEIVIMSQDLDAFVRDRPNGTNLVVEPKGHNLTLRIVDDAEGARLARRAGGLPS